MSIGAPIADAIAIVERHGWHPSPGIAVLGGARAGLGSAYAEERAASRWAEFMVEAALRAAGAAATQRT